MNRLAALLVLCVLAPVPAAAALRVVTTTPGLAALAREVGGDRVEVTSLARGVQDPHFVDASPTLAVSLRGADLLVDVGLDLEVGWLPPLVTQSRNADIAPGSRRRLTAATAVQVLGAPRGPVDRSLGDIHPAGNPHFLSDPRRAEAVAAALAERLGQLDRPGADAYRTRLAAFREKLRAAEARWKAALAPFAGAKAVTHHDSFPYFLEWAGLSVAGYLEPKPGTPPAPSHLAELIGVVRSQKVKAVLVENYHDTRSAEVVAKRTGAKVLAVPGDVGGQKDDGRTLEPKDWFAWMDGLVDRLAKALGA
jgi:zinc/manganese transport system substrate-binding protein